jgi:RNA polymerase sigma-70 factor (ECF subfamily)
MADVAPDGGGMTDGELLAHFLSSRDENALAALVRRHAPMVWGVCCRLLHNHHDAEDAFQATFLVLVRKAADVPRQAVANWLYGVARQTAVRLRATAAKRGRRETQVVNMPELTVPEVRDPDLQAAVDEELSLDELSELRAEVSGLLLECFAGSRHGCNSGEQRLEQKQSSDCHTTNETVQSCRSLERRIARSASFKARCVSKLLRFLDQSDVRGESRQRAKYSERPSPLRHDGGNHRRGSVRGRRRHGRQSHRTGFPAGSVSFHPLRESNERTRQNTTTETLTLG